MKWLLIKNRALGDTVLMTPSINAVKELDPSALIDVAVAELYTPLFQQDPRVRKVYGLAQDKKQWRNPLAEWQLTHYDRAVNFHASPSTAKLTRSVGASKCVIHFHERTPQSGGSDVEIPHLGKPMAAQERDLNAVRAFGWQGISSATSLSLNLNVSRPSRPRVLFSTNASRPAKEWPLEKYLSLAAELKAHAEVIFLFSDPSQITRRGFTASQVESVATLKITPALEDLCRELAQGSLLIGSDSGAKHLAIALGTKTLTLFGPESLGEWHGYDAHLHPAIQKLVRCRTHHPEDPLYAWCGETICPLASHACVNQITVGEVADRVLQLLKTNDTPKS